MQRRGWRRPPRCSSLHLDATETQHPARFPSAAEEGGGRPSACTSISALPSALTQPTPASGQLPPPLSPTDPSSLSVWLTGGLPLLLLPPAALQQPPPSLPGCLFVAQSSGTPILYPAVLPFSTRHPTTPRPTVRAVPCSSCLCSPLKVRVGALEQGSQQLLRLPPSPRTGKEKGCEGLSY